MGTSTVENGTVDVVTEGTKHLAAATSPDECLVPCNPTPVPFPNWVPSARLALHASNSVRIKNKRVCLADTHWGGRSDPAHAGTDGGVRSHAYRGYALATSSSPDLLIEGRRVVRKGDTTAHNIGDGPANTTGQVFDEWQVLAWLSAKHGKPIEEIPRWCALLAGDSAASRRFLGALAATTVRLNQALAAQGSCVRVTEQELAANVLAEGAEKALAKQRADGLDGQYYGGIDTLMDLGAARRGETRINPAWRDWLDPSMIDFLSDPKNVGIKTITLGDGTKKDVAYPANISIEQLVDTAGGMYAASKTGMADYMESRGIDMTSLPPEAQFYWSAGYYNNPGAAQSNLASKGVDFWTVPYAKGVHAQYGVHSNMNRRLAGLELMAILCAGKHQGGFAGE